jgi:hypothetical protein
MGRLFGKDSLVLYVFLVETSKPVRHRQGEGRLVLVVYIPIWGFKTLGTNFLNCATRTPLTTSRLERNRS